MAQTKFYPKVAGHHDKMHRPRHGETGLSHHPGMGRWGASVCRLRCWTTFLKTMRNIRSVFFLKLMFDVFCIYVNIQWTSSRYESWILWPSHHQDHEIFLGSGGYLLWMYKIPINNAINYHINWWTPNFFPSTPPKTNGWHLKMLPQNGKGETSTVQTTNFWVPSTVGRVSSIHWLVHLSGDINENPVTFTSHHCIRGATRALEALWQLGTGWGGGGDLKQLKTLPGS